MATALLTTDLLQTTDAEFRAWVSAAKTALITTCGMTQAADTGQIDVTTVTKPAAGGASQGYLILKPNDGLTDWILKIEFGAGGMGAAQPAIFISLGWATNGAGTLTGNYGQRHRIEIVARANAGVAAPIWGFCKSGSAISMFFDRQFKSGSGSCVLIDRKRDAAGVALTTEVIYWVSVGTDNMLASVAANSAGSNLNFTQFTSEVVPSSGAMPNVPNYAAGQGRLLTTDLVINSGSWSRATNFNLGTLYAWAMDGQTPITIAALGVASVDGALAAEYDVDIYGASHHYMQIGNGNENAYASRFKLLVIWE